MLCWLCCCALLADTRPMQDAVSSLAFACWDHHAFLECSVSARLSLQPTLQHLCLCFCFCGGSSARCRPPSAVASCCLLGVLPGSINVDGHLFACVRAVTFVPGRQTTDNVHLLQVLHDRVLAVSSPTWRLHSRVDLLCTLPYRRLANGRQLRLLSRTVSTNPP